MVTNSREKSSPRTPFAGCSCHLQTRYYSLLRYRVVGYFLLSDITLAEVMAAVSLDETKCGGAGLCVCACVKCG